MWLNAHVTHNACNLVQDRLRFRSPGVSIDAVHVCSHTAPIRLVDGSKASRNTLQAKDGRITLFGICDNRWVAVCRPEVRLLVRVSI